MTIGNLLVPRMLLVALLVAVLALVPFTGAMSQTPVDDRDLISDAHRKDAREFLNTGDGSSIQEVHSYARANYIWPYSRGPQYPAIDIYQQGVIWTPAGVFQLQSVPPIAAELRARGNKLESLGAQYYANAYHTDLGVLDNLRSLIETRGGVYLVSPADGASRSCMGGVAISCVGIVIDWPMPARAKIPGTEL